ncbi:MAG: copper-binding protein [Burkholderiaceae bacterium]
MKTNTIPAALFSGLLAFSPMAHAKEPNDKGGHAAPGAGAMGQSVTMTDGEIRRIDKGAGKLTIKHGEIKHMDMPPMTMVFEVADKQMMDGLKKGEKIRFAVEDRDGRMVITGVEPR